MPRKNKKDYTEEQWVIFAADRKNYLKNLTCPREEPMCKNAKHWLARKWTNRKRKSVPQLTPASYYMEVK